ncbi:MAG: hypothetical protein II304_07685 [Bacteroidales bacterium]|nr:hypothetical protein [Bacteroidales bacterium]
MSKQKFICKHCGKEYFSYKENSMYCSKECKKLDRNVLVACNYCHKEIYVSKHNYERNMQRSCTFYCNKECYDSFMKEQRETLVCKQCGKEFEVFKCEKDVILFCSQKCYKDYRTNQKNEHDKVCPVCGKTFNKSRYQQVYCSKKCAQTVNKTGVECSCDYCGKTFYREKAEYEKRKHHFCSVQCKHSYIGWNYEDMKILEENYKLIPLKEIQKMLSKEYSVKAISNKAKYMKITQSREWTEQETNLLIELYPTKPMKDVLQAIPRKTQAAILGKARKLKLLSHFYISRTYTVKDNEFLKTNYLDMSYEELALQLNRGVNAIKQRMLILDLHKPRERSYDSLSNYIRAHIQTWIAKIKENNNYTCCLTGKRSNIILHHCRGFNLLMEETIDILDFPIYDNISDYTQEQLDEFLYIFMNLQDAYGEYVCITEDIHKQFHSQYGYGNNTIEQWNEFVNNFAS